MAAAKTKSTPQFIDAVQEDAKVAAAKTKRSKKQFSKKIVYSKPSNYGLKNYCVALSGPPLDLNDYSLAPPTRRLQNRNRTASTNG